MAGSCGAAIGHWLSRIQYMRNLESRMHRVPWPRSTPAMSFAQVVFWFGATFKSSQKEQAPLLVSLDMHYCRQVRQIDTLPDSSRPALSPAQLPPHLDESHKRRFRSQLAI